MTKEIVLNSHFALMPESFGGQNKNYADGTTGSIPMTAKWGSHNEPHQLFRSSKWLFGGDWGGSAVMDLNPCCCCGGLTQCEPAQHGEASWKHLTCCDSGAFIQMSTSSAALHQIRELRCDFLLNWPAGGLPVHQVEGKRKAGSRSQREVPEQHWKGYVVCVRTQR